MIRGTTPAIQLYVEGENLTDTRIFVTLHDKIHDKEYTYDSEYDDIELASASASQSKIILSLTQDDTLAMDPVEMEIQVRWIDANENANATEIATIDVSKVLLNKKISFTGGIQQ